jgi:hypothetical protein
MDNQFPNQEGQTEEKLSHLELPSEKRNESVTTEKKKKGLITGLGCVGCGLIGCIGIVIMLLLGTFGSFIYIVNNVFSDKPLEMPSAYLEPAEETLLIEKLAKLEQELENNPGEPTSISLTAKEINFIFQDSANKGNVRMNISLDSDDKITFSLSTPFGDRKDRYFNANGKGSVTVVNGVFNLKMDKLSIGKFNLRSGNFLDGFAKGFSEEITSSPGYQQQPYRIINLNTDNGLLNIELKKVPFDCPAGETEPDDSEELNNFK